MPLSTTPHVVRINTSAGWQDVVIGVSSTGGDKNYVHTQSSPSASWTVAHNLAKFPAVEVVDTGGSTVIPNVVYVDINTVQLTFGSPTSGKAYVN
jgi:hypothetical protein